ncbi:hypothetical protein [Streptomyces sp. NPDC048057]|uniref:hypothetical protein n=1 Tax=Streptomyces sp. NPDC048057 TaxID=3155628 RepID=UPI0033FADB43
MTPDTTPAEHGDHRDPGERSASSARRRSHRSRRTTGRPRTRAAQRRALRREVPGTVGVLTDAHDFHAMLGYDTFPFDDHPAYLRHVEALLASRTADGLYTSVALFDPDDFAEYCTDEGIDPDATRSRSRYTASVAARGDALTYTGQPLGDLLPRLIDNAVRQATWEYAASLLADIGACADCGEDIGKASFDRAFHLLSRLLEAAGPGAHHLVCSVLAPEEHLLAALHAQRDATGSTARIDTVALTEFVTVLATAVALHRPAGVVLRTTTSADVPVRLHGWRLDASSLVPLTEAEVFSAYCTDATTGEPVSPEPNVEYRAGFEVPSDEPDPHH